MRTKKVTKNCKECNIKIENVDSSTLYCSDCNKLIRKKSQKKFDDKNSKNKTIELQIQLDKNFNNIFYKNVYESYHLTTDGFNKISKISCKVYLSFYKISWGEILQIYGKFDELYNYIKNEYINYYKLTKSHNIFQFCENHLYINYRMVVAIGMDKIMDDCGIQKLRYSEGYYKDNFINVINMINHIPLYFEFEQFSSIPISSYAKRFKLKGKVYDNVVKMYVDKDKYIEYKNNQQLHKANVGRTTANIGKTLLTLKELEIEFRKIFDKCFKDTGKYPSGKLFDKLSKHDSSTYRKKLNMRWSGVCRHYGYPIYQDKYVFENYVLKHMSKILDEEYESQKVFPWLRGIYDFSLFCDGYFKKYNLVVEVDGIQHRKPYKKFGGEKAFKILKANDAVKDRLIPEHEIKLLRIADNTKWHDVEYLRSRLESILEIKLANK